MFTFAAYLLSSYLKLTVGLWRGRRHIDALYADMRLRPMRDVDCSGRRFMPLRVLTVSVSVTLLWAE